MAKSKNLSQKGFQDPFGNTTQFLYKLNKSQWNKEFSINDSISSVYHALINNNPAQVVQVSSTLNFRKFISNLKKTTKVTNFSEKFGDFDEVVKCGFEGNDNLFYKQIHFCDNVVELYINNVELVLTPWHDGIMVVSIKVPKSERGNGIATEVMNTLYDVSENVNVPIYLIPYPGEKFKPTDELKLVNKLKVWYRKLGFEKSLQSTNDVWPHIWCNME